MKKNFYRPFLASFFITVLMMCFAGGFLAVDASTATYGLRRAAPLFSWNQSEPLDLTVTFMGETVQVPLKELNKAAGFVQKYATILIPRPLRLVGQGITYGVISYDSWHEEELERRYQESIR